MHSQTGRSRQPSSVSIIRFGIACCALTMAIVIAVAVAAAG
jgi:NADH:ubiquinone oxidoreductase subunit B-like Fe-S oxidoreductase